MKFYARQHQFYCGIDLHAKSLHFCVVDYCGNKRLHQNFQCQNTLGLLQALHPFRKDLIVGCESTFNGYWLADLMQREAIPFILSHALRGETSIEQSASPVRSTRHQRTSEFEAPSIEHCPSAETSTTNSAKHSFRSANQNQLSNQDQSTPFDQQHDRITTSVTGRRPPTRDSENAPTAAPVDRLVGRCRFSWVSS